MEVNFTNFDEQLANEMYSPSTVHSRNSELFMYFRRNLMDMIISEIDFKLPKEWDRLYFNSAFFYGGSICITELPGYSAIPQRYGFYPEKLNIFLRPTRVIIQNPMLSRTIDKEIDTECVIIKFNWDYRSVITLVDYYADLLALASEAVGMNLINSKFSYVFGADSEAQAATVKQIFDDVQKGSPAVVVKKDALLDIQSAEIFSQNVGANYIVSQVLNDIRTIMNQFCTDIGIPNTNYAKKERMNEDEIDQNNDETESKILVWFKEISDGVKKAKEMFGLDDFSVRLRFKDEQEKREKEARENAKADDSESL